jgi:hypothetical protein
MNPLLLIFAVIVCFISTGCSSYRVDSLTDEYFGYGFPSDPVSVSEELKWKLVDASEVLRTSGSLPLSKLQTRSVIRLIEWGNGPRLVTAYVADGIYISDINNSIDLRSNKDRYKSLPSSGVGSAFVILEWRVRSKTGGDYELGFVEISQSEKLNILDKYFRGE